MLLAFTSLGQLGVPVEHAVAVQVLDARQHRAQHRGHRPQVRDALRVLRLDHLGHRPALHQLETKERRPLLRERELVVENVLMKDVVEVDHLLLCQFRSP